MPVVTALKPTRAGGRFSVHVDGRYAFTVGEAFVVRHGLHEGLELSEGEYETLRADAGDDQALTDAARFLAHRTRSRAEVRRRLIDKGHEPAIAETVVARLAADGLIDDPTFAQAFVADKVNLSGWGRERIARELGRLGVARATIDETLTAIDGEEEAARAVAALRRRGPAQPPFDKARKRAFEFLARRGYPTEVVHRAVAEWAADTSPTN